jgi:hypothetical protein
LAYFCEKSSQPRGSGAGYQAPRSFGVATNIGVVHAAGADQLHFFGVDLGLRQQARDDLQALLPARQEQRVDGCPIGLRGLDRRTDLRIGSSRPVADGGLA